VKQAFFGGLTPWEMHKALMCREFHVLPEELDKHPIDSLLLAWNLLGVFDEESKSKSQREGRRKRF